MKKTFYLILLIVPLWMTSCDDNEAPTEDNSYLIFGHFYGECWGEQCVETFKLEDGQLFESETDSYPTGSPYDFQVLSDDKYQVVKGLIDKIPAELIFHPSGTIGCPDCGDWGGLFIEKRSEDAVQQWQIDQKKSNVPEYLYEFIDDVNQKIGIINS